MRPPRSPWRRRSWRGAALLLSPALLAQRKAVKNASVARAEIAKLDPRTGMRLRVRRGDVTRFVFLKVSP